MTELKKKHVLVTGGAGFVGSHLVDELVKRDCTVCVIDDLSNSTIKNLDWAMTSGSVTFHQGSIADAQLIEEICNNNTFEVIFHLASGNLLRSLEDPHLDLAVTGGGILTIMNCIKKMRKKPLFVFSSTGSVYGPPVYSPQDEQHPLSPVSPYGISKLAAEKYLLLWHTLYQLPVVILRYYNIYGPRQHYGEKGGVIGIFTHRAIQKLPLIIEGDGTQERCFTYVSDVTRANILAVEHPDCWGDVYNIAAAETTTIREVAEIIQSQFHLTIAPVAAAARIGDIHEFRPSIEKARSRLQYEPRVSLSEGLKKTITWFTTGKDGV